jgi:hypothetical protein
MNLLFKNILYNVKKSETEFSCISEHSMFADRFLGKKLCFMQVFFNAPTRLFTEHFLSLLQLHMSHKLF